MKKVLKYFSIAIFVLYFLLLFFYGLVIKATYNTGLIGYIKYIPEILLIIYLCFVLFLFKCNVKPLDLFLLFLLFFIFIFSIFDDAFSFSTFSIACRDILIPIVSLVWLKTIIFPKNYTICLKRCLLIISTIFLIVSIPFGYLQRINGWEYTSTFYTGFTFYGKDPLTGSILVNISSGYVRALGLVGSSAKYGFYSIFSYFFLNCFVKKAKKIVFAFSTLFAFLNIYFSTNKTALVLLIIFTIFFIYKIFLNGLFNHKVEMAAVMFVILVVGAYILYNLDYFYSVSQRFDVWRDGIQTSLSINNYNVIIGFHLYSYFQNGELIAIFDNAFLFGVFSLGFLFFTLLLFYLFKSLDLKQDLMVLLLLMFFIGSLTTNIFSGRVFFNTFCILGGLFSCNNCLEEKSSYKHRVFSKESQAIYF